MAVMASSTSVPMVGCGALALRCDQRASFGTQKMLAARYSSGSSGSAPDFLSASSSACLASKASEMYLRKISPRTTCLYSAASMLLRRPSAICQSLDSKPRLAPVVLCMSELFFRLANGYLTRWSCTGVFTGRLIAALQGFVWVAPRSCGSSSLLVTPIPSPSHRGEGMISLGGLEGRHGVLPYGAFRRAGHRTRLN